MLQNNDTPQGAWPVWIAANGGTYDSGTVSLDTYTNDAQGSGGDRGAWWSYKPLTSGTATISDSKIQFTGGAIALYLRNPDGSVGSYVNGVGGSGNNVLTVAVTGGTDYLIYKGVGAGTQCWLTVVGPDTARPPNYGAGNGSFARATVAEISADGGTFVAAPTPNDTLVWDGLTGDRTAWWSYTLPKRASITVSIGEVPTGTSVTGYLWRQTSQTEATYLTAINSGTTYTQQNNDPGTMLVSLSAAPSGRTYRLSVTGPATPSAGNGRSLDNPAEVSVVAGQSIYQRITPPGDGSSEQTWYRYVPAVSGSAHFDTQGMSSSLMGVYLYTGPAENPSIGTLTQVNQNTSGSPQSTLVHELTAGTVYYLQVSAYGDVPHFMSITGPLTAEAGGATNLDVPPIVVEVGGPEPEVTIAPPGPPTFDVPPISVSVGVPSIDEPELPERVVDAQTADPFVISVGTGSAAELDVSFILAEPDPDATVPVSQPEFVFGITQDDDVLYRVELATDTDPAFASPAVTTAEVDVDDSGVTIIPGQELTGTVYWRARLLRPDGSVLYGWSETRALTIDASTSAIELPVTWTVSDSVTAPVHLWYILPPGADPGEQVTIFGQGFGTSPSVSIAGIPTPVIRAEHVIPDPADEQTRVIDGATVDAEHFEIDIIVPDVEEPGGPLLVEA